VSVHGDDAARDLDTVQAQIAVTEAATGRPAAYLAGTRVTNARTGCVGGCCLARLPPPVDPGVIGAGEQARWQVRAAAATDLSGVRLFSPGDSRRRCASDLRARGIDARAVENPRRAVERADAVVTATTATKPVFPGDAFRPGPLVVAVGACTAETRAVDARTVQRARRRPFADVPDEVAGAGDLAAVGVDGSRLQPVADLFDGEGWPPGRDSDRTTDDGSADTGDVTLVESRVRGDGRGGGDTPADPGADDGAGVGRRDPSAAGGRRATKYMFTAHGSVFRRP